LAACWAANHKLITRPDQILRSPPGFGFDVWAMETYVLPRVDELIVDDRVNGRVYRSTADNFRANRLEINRGAGPQYVLPLSYWTAEEGQARKKPSPRPSPALVPPVPAVSNGQARLI